MLTLFERTTERKTLKHPVYYQQTMCQLGITFCLHNKLLIVKRFILNSIGDVLETHKKFGNKVEKSGKWIPSFYLFASIFHFPRVIIFDNGFDSACCIRNHSRQPREIISSFLSRTPNFPVALSFPRVNNSKLQRSFHPVLVHFVAGQGLPPSLFHPTRLLRHYVVKRHG